MRAVIFDWRGTLVLTPTFRGWVTEALRRLGRDTATAPDVIAAIDVCGLETPGVDADATLHREVYYRAFGDAGLGPELADALYGVEPDPAFNPFAVDVAATLHTRGNPDGRRPVPPTTARAWRPACRPSSCHRCGTSVTPASTSSPD